MTKNNKKPLLLALLFCIASATAVTSAEQELFEESQRASSIELDEVRGGYVTGNGVEILFGIEKMLAVNGVLLSNDTLNLVLGTSAIGATAVSGSMVDKAIQNGVGNGIPSALLGANSGTFTFIQNSLDRAFIQNATTMDISVTVKQLYRDLNTSSIVNQQLIHSMH